MTAPDAPVFARGPNRRAFLGCAAACALVGASGAPLPAAGALDTGAITAYLTKIRTDSAVPALGAAIARAGSIVYAGGSGVADLESDSVEDAETVFLVASISKTMSAVAVMQLVESGAVSLEDPIQKYAPWFPQKQATITVRHLMTHTSGIHHYLDDWDPDSGRWAAAFLHYSTFEESTRFWRNDALSFAPGSAWLYTSFGAALLEAVVESASHLSFEEYLKKNIWEPAGMDSTELDVAGRIVAHRDQGYVGDPKSYRRALDEDDSYKYASGGILSTDRDLCRYGIALNAKKLLRADTMREMYRLQLPLDIRSFENSAVHPGRFQALIWMLRVDGSGRTYITHSGSGKGTISLLVNYPDRDIVVSVHRNSQEGPNLTEIALHLADIVL